MGAKSSPCRAELPALTFEVVPLPVLPAHDRAPLTGVEVRCLAAYSPFPIGRKAEMVRRHLARGGAR